MSEQLTFDGPTVCAGCGHDTPGHHDDCYWAAESIPDVPAYKLARRDDPPTSKHAAQTSVGKAGTDRRVCLNAHVRDPGGLTDDEVAGITGLDLQAARRRCVDLRNLGLIEWLKRRDETGELVIVTRRSSGGKRSGVCVLTSTGRIAGMT